jgi:hypothetical protein
MACSVHEGDKNIFVGKLKWRDHSEDLKETGWEGVDWVHVTEDTDP